MILWHYFYTHLYFITINFSFFFQGCRRSRKIWIYDQSLLQICVSIATQDQD